MKWINKSKGLYLTSIGWLSVDNIKYLIERGVLKKSYREEIGYEYGAVAVLVKGKWSKLRTEISDRWYKDLDTTVNRIRKTTA